MMSLRNRKIEQLQNLRDLNLRMALDFETAEVGLHDVGSTEDNRAEMAALYRAYAQNAERALNRWLSQK